MRFGLMFVLVGSLLTGIIPNADAEVWVIGRGGERWGTYAEVAGGVDLTTPGVLGPAAFADADNVTRSIQWVNASPEDFIAEGNGHIWDNAAATGAGVNSTLTLVDGDGATSTGDRFSVFGVNQNGRIFFMDLGASFPANRVIFYPQPTNQDGYIRSYELAINDGRNYSRDETPIYEIARQVELNREWRTEVTFPTQLLRFVRLRVFSPNPFELAEIEVHGEGFVPKGSYESSLIELAAPVNFGTLAFRTIKVRRQEDGSLVPEPAAAAGVTLQMRNGQDDTPLVYFEIVDEETGREEETTKGKYDVLSDAKRGRIRTDLANWSPWTEALKVDSSGIYGVPLDLPGPRSYFQFRLLFEGTTSDAMQVDSLSVTYSAPLAAGVIGEVALLDEPTPARGLVTVAAGADTTLTYDVRADLGSPSQAGFDGVRIFTPSRSQFLRLQMGTPLTEVEPDSVREDVNELRVYFPAHRIDQGRDERLRIIFKSSSLLYTTLFEGQLLDTEGRLPQGIKEGDANEDVNTNSLRVLFTSGVEKVLKAFDVVPPIITPNGDGFNDQIAFSYSIVHLVEPAAVRVEIYDLAGQLVREVFSGELSAGQYRDNWDGTDRGGKVVSPGIYLARVTVDAEEEESKQIRTVHVAY